MRILNAASRIRKVEAPKVLAPAEVLRPDTVSALERGIAVLRCFSESRHTLTATELSRLTGVPRPTVTRLASTLLTLGLLQAESQTEAYQLGPGVLSLARTFLAGLDIRAVARPHMQELAESTGGSVYLAVRDGLDMVLIEACRPRSTMLAPRLDVGSRAPIANSALGRAYLWAMNPEQRQSLMDALRLARAGEFGALEPGLQKALADADQSGWCISAGEFHREINSVSVPLVGPTGKVMALTCGTAAFVFAEDHLQSVVAPQLLKTAIALASDVGGHVPRPERIHNPDHRAGHEDTRT